MTGEEATAAVIDGLAVLHIPYLLAGSFASNYYGIPRSTEDADFVVQMGGCSLRDLTHALGPAFRLDPQMAFETVTGTLYHVIEVPENQFRIELFHLSEDEHDKERFRRRCPVKLLGRKTFLPTAEDVVITKLRWFAVAGRAKDRDDSRDVIAVQGDRLDWNYLLPWCEKHGTREILEQIRQSVPPL